MQTTIDIKYDFRTDARGMDPDSASPTLRRYHRILWSKELPNGKKLILDEKLKNISDAGNFAFASDSIIHTFSRWKRYKHIINQVPPSQIEVFHYLGYTIGGMTIFPSNRVNGKATINGERGLNHKIKDRIDLTLECIKRYYSGEENPLADCLNRYSEFFGLFSDFKGYVDFFLFQNLVEDNHSRIRFLHPFKSFNDDPLPATVDEYLKYRDKSIDFIIKRNTRIDNWANENCKI